MSLAAEGMVSKFLNESAPKELKHTLSKSTKRDILNESYPYKKRLSKKKYFEEMAVLQIELAKFQAWMEINGQRVAILFEGRDAAGKGGCIRATTENLNPRVSRVVALSKPTERELGEWYFQRYISHLPTAGTMTIFDRSWYNRAVVEKVFGFCNDTQLENFFLQTPQFETMLAEEGIILIKIWLNVGRAEQLNRFLRREKDPLKQWKLSEIDVKGLSFWDEYSQAIRSNFAKTNHPNGKWCVVKSDDKKRARLQVIKHILSLFEYDYKDHSKVGTTDPKLLGGPEIWSG